ncbi:hypothetical protein D3C81_1756380 [compost metagenome]
MVSPKRLPLAWGSAGTRSPLRNGSMHTPSAPIGACSTSLLNCSTSRSSSSRIIPVALVRFMVQINGSQPPLDEQNVATAASGMTCG